MNDPLPISLLPTLCVLARSAGFVAAGSWPLLPGSCLRIRIAATIALSAACLPHAFNAADSAPSLATVPLEAVVGCAMGFCVAAVSAAVSWAVSFALSAVGEDPQPDVTADEPSPVESIIGTSGALAQLAFWMGTAAFFSAGGERWIVGGLIGSYRSMPPGVWGEADVGRLVLELASSGFTIAVSLAIPLLAALVTFRLTTAIVLRTANLSPGPGLLQAATMIVALVAIVLAGDLWAGRLGNALEGPLERAVGSFSHTSSTGPTHSER